MVIVFQVRAHVGNSFQKFQTPNLNKNEDYVQMKTVKTVIWYIKRKNGNWILELDKKFWKNEAGLKI